MDAQPDPGPDPADDRPMGLRERKKIATKTALAQAALKLSIERGLDAVTVEAIAAEVDVSPRTFFNYFSSKEEAVLADHQARFDQMRAELRSRPASEPIDVAIRNTLAIILDEAHITDRNVVKRIRLVYSHPALRTCEIAVYAAKQRAFAQIIADRTGTDVDKDYYPLFVAATISAALQAATHWWIETEGPMELGGAIALMLDQLAPALEPPKK